MWPASLIALTPIRLRTLFGCLLAVAAVDLPAMAQQAAPLPLTFHLGPLGVSPLLGLNTGVETNTTGTAEDQEQVRNFVAQIVPGLNYNLPIRRVLATGQSHVGYIYRQGSVSERSVDLLHEGRLELRSDLVSPRVLGAYGYNSARPTTEIDSWVRQLNRRFGAGADVRLGSQLTVTLDADRSVPGFAGQEFRNADLEKLLNRRTDSLRASVRMALTPFTTFVVSGDETRDRFEFSPVRDTESLTGLIGVQLQPAALISGTASVGYRRQRAFDPTVPDFNGVVANVGVSYLLRGVTRLALDGRRTTEYSAVADQPYYVVTGGRFTVTQQVGRGWDFVAGVGRDELAYRRLTATDTSQTTSRLDFEDTLIGGFGHRLGQRLRLGLDVNYITRRSPVKAQAYDAWRGNAGITFRYGS